MLLTLSLVTSLTRSLNRRIDAVFIPSPTTSPSLSTRNKWVRLSFPDDTVRPATTTLSLFFPVVSNTCNIPHHQQKPKKKHAHDGRRVNIIAACRMMLTENTVTTGCNGRAWLRHRKIDTHAQDSSVRSQGGCHLMTDPTHGPPHSITNSRLGELKFEPNACSARELSISPATSITLGPVRAGD